MQLARCSGNINDYASERTGKATRTRRKSEQMQINKQITRILIKENALPRKTDEAQVNEVGEGERKEEHN